MTNLILNLIFSGENLAWYLHVRRGMVLGDSSKCKTLWADPTWSEFWRGGWDFLCIPVTCSSHISKVYIWDNDIWLWRLYFSDSVSWSATWCEDFPVSCFVGLRPRARPNIWARLCNTSQLRKVCAVCSAQRRCKSSVGYHLHELSLQSEAGKWCKMKPVQSELSIICTFALLYFAILDMKCSWN